MKQCKKKTSFYDILLSQISEKADEVGYALLARNGYDVSGARESETVRANISRKMERRQESLNQCWSPDGFGHIIFRFELIRHGKHVAYSQSIKLIPNFEEGGYEAETGNNT